MKIPSLHCDARVQTVSADVINLPINQVRALSPKVCHRYLLNFHSWFWLFSIAKFDHFRECLCYLMFFACCRTLLEVEIVGCLWWKPWYSINLQWLILWKIYKHVLCFSFISFVSDIWSKPLHMCVWAFQWLCPLFWCAMLRRSSYYSI